MVSFTETPLPGEPDTDMKLVLDTGMQLRERMTVTAANSDGVRSPADVASTAFTVCISNALLDASGSIETRGGKACIARAVELTLTHEMLGRIGDDAGVNEVIMNARKQAAEEAWFTFRGAEMARTLILPRAGVIDPITSGEE